MSSHGLRSAVRLLAVLALNVMWADAQRVAGAIRLGPGSPSSISETRAVHREPANGLGQNEPSLRKGSYSKGTIPNSVTLRPLEGAPPRSPRRDRPAPLQVGVTREIPASGATLLDAGALIWNSIGGGGRVTAVSVTSPGAVALRLAVTFTKLPAGAEVRFFSLDISSQVFGPLRMDQIRALTIPSQAGEPGVFWSPVVTGDTVGMEIYVPNRADEAEVSFTIPRLSHQYATPAAPREAARR